MLNKYKLIYTGLIAFACNALLLGCKDNVELPYQPVDSYSRVYMPQAVNNPVMATLRISDTLQTLTYGADFGGQNYPTTDIPVSFKVDSALVDSFNMANKTNYSLLPGSCYTLSAYSAVIPKGQLSTEPLSLNIKTNGANAMPALKAFVLPITIYNTTIKINPTLRTTFFVVTAQPDFNDYQNYDRTLWQIIGFSSQEAVGEGPNNGRAIFAIDGDVNTYWHSQWDGASPGPPHYLTIDMGEVKTIHGLSFVGRQSDGAGKPNDVAVQVSMDNITWVDAGEFNLLNSQSLQKQFLPNGFQTARYFKVIINSAYGGSYTQIAELNAF
jgi:hypothetical protein